MLESPKFISQASVFAHSLETALDMIGPNTEMVTEILTDLGQRHFKHYGVSSSMYPHMGEAVFETLAELLPHKHPEDPEEVCWNDETEKAWRELWYEFMTDMTAGEREYIHEEMKKFAAPNTAFAT